MRIVTPLFLFTLLLLLPSTAFAAEPLDWKTHGVIAFLIAVSVSVFFIRRNKSYNTVTAKMMAFGVYFWVLIFLQAILYGIYYGYFR